MDANQQLFAMALGLQEPWYIEDIRFSSEERKLDIYLNYREGALFPCGICAEPYAVRDSREKCGGIWTPSGMSATCMRGCRAQVARSMG